MWSRRNVISHALQRRASLEALRRPARTLNAPEACDAEPILVTSALHHGEISETPCPICEREHLLNLNYTFGDQLGMYSGRIKSTAELDEMQNNVGEFTVRVVEVCPDCRWNHLIETYTLGDGRKRRRPRREETVEDIYG
ncbi:DUF5318 family protein [Aestuariimicrobium soli]|uniref:DUF5318 family protein n=1 Tax=Aestuariimicrobium soli TaxID=2035834 RepID=UPI003EBF2784